MLTSDPGSEPDERTAISTALALIVDSGDLYMSPEPRIAVQVFHPDGRIELRQDVRVYDTGREALASEDGWERVAVWPEGAYLETSPEERVDPRESLRALAAKLERRADRAASEDAAHLFAEAARIWEFLDANPVKEPVTVVPPRLAEGGTVDTEKLTQWARQMSSRRGQA
ncbi:hypothetical protein [Parafrankia sp. EUN1f]|uniref:hypothetical protein n=1 Tax=Parafrankia sp. EUN1f TaxID=102897 RepID=UPI0003016C5E|nr:hypothetical protein [Parafrankia sp. EUN1f]